MQTSTASFLPSVLLQVRSTSNIANGNKWVIFFVYYSDMILSYEPLISLDVHDAVHITCNTWYGFSRNLK